MGEMKSSMVICIATGNDIEQIKKLWKKQGDVLGIPYNNTIIELIRNKALYCIKDENENVVAFCGYKIMKRTKVAKIVHLVVAEEHRRKKLGVSLVWYLYNILIPKKLPVVIECKDGADNNYFYDKIGRLITTKHCKTMDVRLYVLDYNKITAVKGENYDRRGVERHT